MAPQTIMKEKSNQDLICFEWVYFLSLDNMRYFRHILHALRKQNSRIAVKEKNVTIFVSIQQNITMDPQVTGKKKIFEDTRDCNGTLIKHNNSFL